VIEPVSVPPAVVGLNFTYTVVDAREFESVLARVNVLVNVELSVLTKKGVCAVMTTLSDNFAPLTVYDCDVEEVPATTVPNVGSAVVDKNTEGTLAFVVVPVNATFFIYTFLLADIEEAAP
jgi:hypothetical protein